jgi:membrane protease YdiL (CAAX protease family)
LILVEGFTFLITWVYLRTNHNLFSALLLHTSINAWLSVFPPIEKVDGGNQLGLTYLTVLYAITAAVLVLADRRRFFKALEQPAPEPG